MLTVLLETDDIRSEKEEAGHSVADNRPSNNWRNSKGCPCNAAPFLGALSCKLKERLCFFRVSYASLCEALRPSFCNNCRLVLRSGVRLAA